MFVIMMNFNVAQITSTFERVSGLEQKIVYEMKAELNKETYMLLDKVTCLPSYRCIVFATSKSSEVEGQEILDE